MKQEWAPESTEKTNWERGLAKITELPEGLHETLTDKQLLQHPEIIPFGKPLSADEFVKKLDYPVDEAMVGSQIRDAEKANLQKAAPKLVSIWQAPDFGILGVKHTDGTDLENYRRERSRMLGMLRAKPKEKPKSPSEA
eukprot:GSA25T00002891001.1